NGLHNLAVQTDGDVAGVEVGIEAQDVHQLGVILVSLHNVDQSGVAILGGGLFVDPLDDVAVAALRDVIAGQLSQSTVVLLLDDHIGSLGAVGVVLGDIPVIEEVVGGPGLGHIQYAAGSGDGG